jgi:hypothetical protein
VLPVAKNDNVESICIHSQEQGLGVTVGVTVDVGVFVGVTVGVGVGVGVELHEIQSANSDDTVTTPSTAGPVPAAL